jgi:hypothetical protein
VTLPIGDFVMSEPPEKTLATPSSYLVIPHLGLALRCLITGRPVILPNDRNYIRPWNYGAGAPSDTTIGSYTAYLSRSELWSLLYHGYGVVPASRIRSVKVHE